MAVKADCAPEINASSQEPTKNGARYRKRQNWSALHGAVQTSKTAISAPQTVPVGATTHFGAPGVAA
ncbi:hypothetical protein E4U25_005594 [Claviceps purpurea]|nr:hypothetical protein E4U25_005594 [Claviceps purpurea]